MLRHRAPFTISAFAISRGCSARRRYLQPSSAFLRHRRRSRRFVLHEAHRRPAARQRVTWVGVGRRPPSIEYRHRVDDRRQCARGIEVRFTSAPASSPKAMPSRSPRSAASSRTRLRDRDAERSAGAARPQGRGSGEVLIARHCERNAVEQSNPGYRCRLRFFASLAMTS